MAEAVEREREVQAAGRAYAVARGEVAQDVVVPRIGRVGGIRGDAAGAQLPRFCLGIRHGIVRRVGCHQRFVVGATRDDPADLRAVVGDFDAVGAAPRQFGGVERAVPTRAVEAPRAAIGQGGRRRWALRRDRLLASRTEACEFGRKRRFGRHGGSGWESASLVARRCGVRTCGGGDADDQRRSAGFAEDRRRACRREHAGRALLAAKPA
jgi:hypothetical protein